MRTATATILMLGCIGLGGCSPPEPPDEERRPAPRAQAKPASVIVQSANAYKDRARDAGAASMEAADRQRRELDAASQ